MLLSQKYKDLLNKVPRRTNECWLGDMFEGNDVYVCGYKFLVHLEGTALRIWQLMDGNRTMAELVEQLNKEYSSIARDVILEDSISYVIHLEKAGVAAWRSRPLFEEVKLDR
ncbi:MAG: PqqD family protein [Thermodesulfobacteriales bacterium]|nr:MAG: PqqD family protein [Thermodesulfobacteriales bacterium]